MRIWIDAELASYLGSTAPEWEKAKNLIVIEALNRIECEQEISEDSEQMEENLNDMEEQDDAEQQ